MRCTAYCTAASYNLVAFFHFLKSECQSMLYRDAIHLTKGEGGDIFFFSYGVMVAWGVGEEEEREVLDKLKGFEVDPLGVAVVKEVYDFCYGDTNKIQRDELTLASRDPLTKRAISYGLAQSAKLTLFEETINKTITKTKHLPEDLAKKGKIFLSRREISQKIGELFTDRSSVNLHSDILDEPDFFWEYSEHRPIYVDTTKCFDIATRVAVLNSRLAIVGELLGMLSDQLNHQHSSTLEWTIIWLIVIEVILALLSDVFHLI